MTLNVPYVHIFDECNTFSSQNSAESANLRTCYSRIVRIFCQVYLFSDGDFICHFSFGRYVQSTNIILMWASSCLLSSCTITYVHFIVHAYVVYIIIVHSPSYLACFHVLAFMIVLSKLSIPIIMVITKLCIQISVRSSAVLQ